MMKKNTCVALFCSGVLAWSGVLQAQTLPAEEKAPPPPTQASPKEDAPTTTSALDAKLFYEILLGEITFDKAEKVTGISLILNAAQKTNDAQLYQRAVVLALQARSAQTALAAARVWKQAQPESVEAQRAFLQILLALGRVEETAEPLRAWLQATPMAQRPSIFELLPRFYAQVKEKKQVTATLEKVLAPYAAQPATAAAAWTALGRLRWAAADAAGALQAAQNAQAAQASGDGAALLALELMASELPQAEASVQKYLQAAKPALPEIRLVYARNLLQAQRYAEASEQLQTVVRDKPNLAEAWLVLGSLQQQNGQWTQAQDALNRYLALVPEQIDPAQTERGVVSAYLLLAQIAEKRKDFAAALAWLNKIDSPEALVQVQVRRASLLAQQGQWPQAWASMEQLPQSNETEARSKLMAKISLLRDFRRYQQAYDLLAQGVEAAPNDTDLLYEQAMVAEKLNLFDAMETLLRRVMQLKPDYHHAYNALGYSLAERGVRLLEAKALIEKALSFAPADPFIKDSLAWVEFRLGRTSEALAIFQAIYAVQPDPEIAAHFGEVLWIDGQRERARSVWSDAKARDGENETLVKTLKRLGVNL